MSSITHHPQREKGQGLVEYALILVLVSVAVIAILTFLGDSIDGVFEQVNDAMSGQTITGNGTEYTIGSFSATASGGPALCTINVSSFSVTKYQDGEKVGAGESVSVSISATGGGTSSGSGTTDGNGVANISATSVNGNCSGQVTVSVGGASRSVSYSN